MSSQGIETGMQAENPGTALAVDEVADGLSATDAAQLHKSLWARIPDAVIASVLAIALLVCMELSARYGWVSKLILPAPSEIFEAGWEGFSSGIYLRHIYSTLAASLIGFVLASVLAVALAGLLVSSQRLENVIMPFVIGLNTLPKVAISPLVILWVGFGQDGKVLIVMIVVFFPVLINALSGLRIRDADQYNVFVALGASKLQIFRYLRLPNSVPQVFAGLHIGLVFALIGAIVAEFVGSRDGLGYLLMIEKSHFNVPGVFAVLAILMILGMAANLGMRKLEHRMTSWTYVAQKEDNKLVAI